MKTLSLKFQIASVTILSAIVGAVAAQVLPGAVFSLRDFLFEASLSPQDRLAAIQVAEKWEREIGYWEQQEAASDGL